MFATPPRQKNNRKAASASKSTPDRDQRHLEIHVRDGAVSVSANSVGEGPTVMLVHGWGGSGSDLTAIAGAFARVGWRAVWFDVPGHGRSPGKESSMVQFLGAMRAVSAALGPPDLIVGHSLGGAAAVLGITELRLPVRGAVLFCPAPGPAHYIDRFVRAVGLPPERTDGMVRHLVARVGRPMESFDALAAARAATVPALIFHDPADRQVPFEFAERMADSWPESRLIPVKSLGHKRILRDPAAIAAAVDFAQSLLA